MNGTLIPHTPIAVDFWKIRECPHARIFFLTHLHGDHITGLTSSWSYPIYCSEITGKLLVQRYGIKEDLIHTMQTESAEIIYLDNEQKEQMTVTAIEANHCPGAVMFLMQGYFGTILHTGDFRYHPDMINQSILSEFSGKVDMLYLDNTYCSPGCVFPTKDEATNQIIEIIEKHPNKDVLIAMRNLGKESLLCKIAMHFQEWISVPDKFYKTLEILEAPDVFSTDSASHRIRIVPFHKISNRFVEVVNQEQETIVILPTALYRGIEATPYENNDKVFVVPYSDHSSYTELNEFVSLIKPKKIIPIVKSNSRGPFGISVADRADMACFDKFTSSGWTSRIEIPVSVQAFMYCKTSKVLAVEKNGLKRKTKLKPPTKKVKRGIDYDSPLSTAKHNNEHPASASKQKTQQKVKSPLSSSKQKDKEYSSKDDKENSNNLGKDSSHVRQLLFDQVAVKRSKVDCIKIQGEERIKTAKTEKITDKNRNVINNNSEKLELNLRQQGENQKVKQLKVNNESSHDNLTKGKEGIDKGVCREVSGNQNRKYTIKSLGKKPAEKLPLQFVCSNKDLSFDNVFGMRTYSKTNKRFRSFNDISTSMTNDIEEDSKMSETAKWVLESSQFTDNLDMQMDKLSDEQSETDISILNKGKGGNEKGFTGKNASPGYKTNEKVKNGRKKYADNGKCEKTKRKSDKKEPISERMRIDGKLKRSDSLKQTTLSQYVTETKGKAKSKAVASTDQEIYFATKLCTDSGKMGESLSEEENVIKGEIKEIEPAKDCERDNNLVICSDSENEKEFLQQNIVKTDPLLEEPANKGDISKSNERNVNSRKENDSKAEAELFDDLDSFSESVVAQAGTQVCNLNVSIGNRLTQRRKMKFIVKAKDKKGNCEDERNQVTCADDPDVGNYTANDRAQHRNEIEKREKPELSTVHSASQGDEEGNSSTFVSKGSQHRSTVTEGIKSTISKVDSELLARSNCTTNMSILVNIGSQKEARTSSFVDQTAEMETNFSPSKTQTHYCHQNTMVKEVQEHIVRHCRECELDAFKYVFDKIENEELNQVLDGSSSKQYDANHDITKKRKYNEKFKQIAFIVKPINAI
ncbi:uncharacterized protein LOC132744840 isoform X1 [Ruditapes philippinarum]|uniref:uncharacterized protein LOC132744840 isoform X1 n=1 Tax=Ruditapes philippinarum TaxID=129788 RepID=UPI00295B98D9|nr:uncharacterized protein LOC132744840 isoform X1 [Ruditapes philippinarum]